MTVLRKPAYPIQHIGVTELVGKDEQVDQNELGAAVSVSVASQSQPVSMEIDRIVLYATEDGTGAIQDSAGTLLVFSADPGHSVGDDGSGVSGAEWQTCVLEVTFDADDWVAEDNGAVAQKSGPWNLHALSTLHLVWLHTDATSLNDAAADDEVLDCDMWYQRYS